MSNTVIKIENLSKIYRLGEVGTGTLSHDLNRWWKMNILRQDDPYAKIGHVNDRTQKAEKGELIAALRDINLEVKQGEVLGIIGKNGAGKSTLLKLLSRVTSPTTGTIKTKGRLASLLEVGTGFHPEMTGRENIYMNGTIMGMRRWEITRKLDEIVDFAGVAKYLDTPTKRYSSGMTVRLGFAIAAFLEPEILIVDEVLAVGDAEFQKKAIGKMQDVSKGGGRTVLFVSHNMASVESLCSLCCFIENGRIKEEGRTSEIIESYLRSGYLPINLKENDKREGNGGLRIIELYFDNGKEIKNNFKIGEIIVVNAKILNKKQVPDFHFVFSIYDSKNVLISSVSSWHQDFLAQISNEDYVLLTFNLGTIAFNSGNYRMNIVLYQGSYNHPIILDKIESYLAFSIIESDFFNTGRIQNFGAIVSKPNIKIDKSKF